MTHRAKNWHKAEWRTCKKCGGRFFHQFFRICENCRTDVHDARAVYIPTEEEIRDACEKIREKWTDDEEQKRIAGEADKRKRFELPTFRRTSNAHTRKLMGVVSE